MKIDETPFVQGREAEQARLGKLHHSMPGLDELELCGGEATHGEVAEGALGLGRAARLGCDPRGARGPPSRQCLMLNAQWGAQLIKH